MDHITSEKLFEQLPETRVLPDKIYDLSYISGASTTQLIDLTHSAITARILEPNETLRMWELRLTLHLFNGKLAVAKKEAINLNTSIYLHENPDQALRPPVPEKINSSAPNAPQYVYPLPRNNDNSIPYRLLLLLLRLKSTPSMGMVNECYRVCYQLRLRGLALQTTVLQNQLIQLAYLIIVELVITKNSLTLISYLKSLLKSLEDQLQSNHPTNKVNTFAANVKFMLLLAHAVAMLRTPKDSAVQELQFETLREPFNNTPVNVLDSLRFALNSWASHVGGPTPEEKLSALDMTFEAVISMLRKGRISTRIICCTLAIWDLDTTFDATIIDDNIKVEVPKHDERLEGIYSHVMSQWGAHANRVFCIE